MMLGAAGSLKRLGLSLASFFVVWLFGVSLWCCIGFPHGFALCVFMWLLIDCVLIWVWGFGWATVAVKTCLLVFFLQSLVWLGCVVFMCVGMGFPHAAGLV